MDDLVPPIHCTTCSTIGGGSGEIYGLTQRSEGVIDDAEYDAIYKHFFNVQLQNEPQSTHTKPKTITKPRYHRRHTRNHSITKRGKSGRKPSARLSNKKSKRVKRHTRK